MITRRSFLTATAAFLAAPAIVRASSLMPVKAWAEEEWVVLAYEHTTFWLSQDRFYIVQDGVARSVQWSDNYELADWSLPSLSPQQCPELSVRLAT